LALGEIFAKNANTLYDGSSPFTFNTLLYGWKMKVDMEMGGMIYGGDMENGKVYG